MDKEHAIKQAITLIEKRENHLRFQRLASMVLFITSLAMLGAHTYSLSKVDDLANLSQRFNDAITHEQHSKLLEIVDSKIKLALTGHKIENNYMTLLIGVFLGISTGIFFTYKRKRSELEAMKNVLKELL